MTKSFARYATAAAIAAGALVSTAAFAEAGYEPTHVSVRTADLNLASAQGRATVERRVRAAADVACSIDGDRSLKAMAHARACRGEAITTALRSVDTAVARAKSSAQVASLSTAGVANGQ